MDVSLNKKIKKIKRKKIKENDKNILWMQEFFSAPTLATATIVPFFIPGALPFLCVHPTPHPFAQGP
jgi:hypothetical protein